MLEFVIKFLAVIVISYIAITFLRIAFECLSKILRAK